MVSCHQDEKLIPIQLAIQHDRDDEKDVGAN